MVGYASKHVNLEKLRTVAAEFGCEVTAAQKDALGVKVGDDAEDTDDEDDHITEEEISQVSGARPSGAQKRRHSETEPIRKSMRRK